MWCLKCKAHTNSADEKLVPTLGTGKSGRLMNNAKCVKCGDKKSCFVKSPAKVGSAVAMRSVNTTKPRVRALSKREHKALSHIQRGGSLLNWLIEKNPVELHLIDQGDDGKIRRASFAGPGTNLTKRLDANTGEPVAGSLPINRLDRGAYYHDLAYRDSKEVVDRNRADAVLRDVATVVINDPKSTFVQRVNARLVRRIMQHKLDTSS